MEGGGGIFWASEICSGRVRVTRPNDKCSQNSKLSFWYCYLFAYVLHSLSYLQGFANGQGHPTREFKRYTSNLVSCFHRLFQGVLNGYL